ncbi:MAG TPA: DNA repair protein RecO C-terminal domain-containing protein, partial [Sphingobacteriaceae bacterium]
SIKQQTADEVLFEFLFQSIELLDKLDEGLANFHLHFLLNLSRFLGFYPDRTLEERADYFDLKEGAFVRSAPSHVLVLQQPHTSYWSAILKSHVDGLPGLRIPAEERKFILRKILDFYQVHIEGFGSVKSHQILEEVLS